MKTLTDSARKKTGWGDLPPPMIDALVTVYRLGQFN